MLDINPISAQPAGTPAAGPTRPDAYQAPAFEVICLDCEITAYAPDGDLPLF